MQLQNQLKSRRMRTSNGMFIFSFYYTRYANWLFVRNTHIDENDSFRLGGKGLNCFVHHFRIAKIR